MNAKALNSTQLAKLNRAASRRNYNRTLSPGAINDLDPEGIHILNPILLHEHAAGVSVPAHWRCIAYLKMEGRKAPVEAMLDVQPERLERLVDAADLTRVVADG